MKHCQNRRLLARQQEELERRLRPGERLARHPVTQHGIYVCAHCGCPGHTSEVCTGGPLDSGAGSVEGASGSESKTVRACPEEAGQCALPPCWHCGILPFVLGLDVTAKVCMNLSSDAVRRRMDYSTGCSICSD